MKRGSRRDRRALVWPYPDDRVVTKRGRRAALAVILALVVVALVGLILLGTALASLLPSPPSRRSDNEMIARFREHRGEFRELLRLTQKRSAARAGGSGGTPDGQRGRLSPAERQRYRQLKKTLGIEFVEQAFGETSFYTAVWGIVSSGWSQGYVYAKKTPYHVVADTERDATGGEGVVHRHIEDYWYLVYEWN